MPQTQKEWIRILQDSGWTRDRGGKHQVKMTKPGERPITLPENKRRATARGSRRRSGARRVFDPVVLDRDLEWRTR